MPGLTIERENKIIMERKIKNIRERLNKIKAEIMELMDKDNVYPKQIKSLWERIESIECQTDNMGNRNTI